MTVILILRDTMAKFFDLRGQKWLASLSHATKWQKSLSYPTSLPEKCLIFRDLRRRACSHNDLHVLAELAKCFAGRTKNACVFLPLKQGRINTYFAGCFWYQQDLRTFPLLYIQMSDMNLIIFLAPKI